MSRVLLARHAQSYANKRDFAAFGNIESPLTEKGIKQAMELGRLLSNQYDIIPEEYELPVLASEYVRSKQTAEIAGFRNIHVDELINECEMREEIGSGIDVIRKHREEGWVPKETRENAKLFLDLVSDGYLEYEVYFTHGMFIAGVLTEFSGQGQSLDHDFDPERGYIPLQASITELKV